MAARKDEYIPALNKHFFTPLYDPIMRYVMREEVFKRILIDHANPLPAERILDLGCGTGTLTLMIQKHQPDAVVYGLDADPEVLAIARRKAAQSEITGIHWSQGLADDLSYADCAFDLVLTSMVLHHLTHAKKHKGFQEVARVLSPNGRFLIADFGKPRDGLMRLVTFWMSKFEQTAEHFNGHIPQLLRSAGFGSITELEYFRTLFGPVTILRAIVNRL